MIVHKWVTMKLCSKFCLGKNRGGEIQNTCAVQNAICNFITAREGGGWRKGIVVSF